MKKFLDLSGLEYLLSQLPAQDYDNILASIVDAIDSIKEDKGKATIDDTTLDLTTHVVTITTDGITSTFTLLGVDDSNGNE